ncbi:hypothetical protein [Streptomyces sp. NPDC102370]|uniref:hypothetical protein n=1 Tax=Streptomyces sp. NPDC102370 TaxID=3366163 RepID=UPI00381F94E1
MSKSSDGYCTVRAHYRRKPTPRNAKRRGCWAEDGVALHELLEPTARPGCFGGVA